MDALHAVVHPRRYVPWEAHRASWEEAHHHNHHSLLSYWNTGKRLWTKPYYRIARNFRGPKFSRFSRISRKFYPRKFYPRPRTHATRTDTPAVSELIAMAFYRYIQTSDKSTTLSDPRGPLSRLVPSSSIASANEKVKDLWKNEERIAGRKGTRYLKELKAEISRQAAEHGASATVRFYAQKLPDHVLKESSVRTWRNAYTGEMQTSSALTCHQIHFPVGFPATFWHAANFKWAGQTVG